MFFLEKYLKQNSAANQNFKKFYKTRLIAENAYLKSIIPKFSPFDEIMTTEITFLKSEKFELVERIK